MDVVDVVIGGIVCIAQTLSININGSVDGLESVPNIDKYPFPAHCNVTSTVVSPITF